MNSIFYQFILILSTIHTAKKRLNGFMLNNIQLSDKKKFKTSDMDFEGYHSKFQASKEFNVKYKFLYDCIVKEFAKTFIKYNKLYTKLYDKSEYGLEIIIPETYGSNMIRNFCNEKKESFYKEIVMVNAVEEAVLVIVLDFFVEFAKFAFHIMKTVHEMRSDIKDDIEFRNSLIDDTTLLENFIISVNWFNQLTDIQFEFSLLHNYEKIEAKGCNSQQNMSLFITYVFYNELEMSYTYKDVREESSFLIKGKYYI